MADISDQILAVKDAINRLEKQQNKFQEDMIRLKSYVQQLEKQNQAKNPFESVNEDKLDLAEKAKETASQFEKDVSPISTVSPKSQTPTQVFPASPKQQTPNFFEERFQKISEGFESFIGENLISKIGILILVIGVGVGAKYAIDNELISPLTRIILGYIMAVGLIFFAIKLKPKYENFSAVLISGGMMICYFLTYMAYDFYQLIPWSLTFGLMVVFTAFTVFAALQFKKEIISILGLAGAYAVPFLLSTGSNNFNALFLYNVIVNIGILIICYYQNWHRTKWLSFVFSWVILSSAVFLNDISTKETSEFLHNLSLPTLTFIEFYLIALAYHWNTDAKLKKNEVVFMVLNSFVFFLIGTVIVSEFRNGSAILQTSFAVFNAIIHLVVGIVLKRNKSVDKGLIKLVIGSTLVCLTVAIPLQFDGFMVSVLWAAESALLFYIGRSRNEKTFEQLSYPLMLVAFMSLSQDWELEINQYFDLSEQFYTPIFNSVFFSNLLFIGCFVLIVVIQMKNKKQVHGGVFKNESLNKMTSYMGFIILLICSYALFYIEIQQYWRLESYISMLDIADSDKYFQSTANLNLKALSLIIYSSLFALVYHFISNLTKNTKVLKISSIVFSILTTNVLLLFGLYMFGELREFWIKDKYYLDQSIFHFVYWVRYIAIGLAVSIITNTYYMIKNEGYLKSFDSFYIIYLNIVILWLLSSEVIHWMDIANINSYGLGLSILWVSYALFLTFYGIKKQDKLIRFASFGLIAITLVKLFVYDLSKLDTIAKTIVLVVVGILLLVISFLYNKFKSQYEQSQTTTRSENTNED